MKQIIEAIMDGHPDPTSMIFERLQELGWRSPDEVAELRRQLHSSGKWPFDLRPAPPGASIKGCAHCGTWGALVIDPASTKEDKWYFVECPACLVRTASFENPREAIGIWNRRLCDEQDNAKEST